MLRLILKVLALVGVTSVHAATFTVTNLNDSGAGSLRQAIIDANAAAGADTVDFTPGLTGTIVLTSGSLGITSGPLTIVGPGAASLTISGNASSRIFSIFENVADSCATPGTDFLVSISGLTLTNGLRSNVNSAGGAIYAEKTLSLSSVIISNSVAFSGGGIAFSTNYSGQSLTITNSQILNNVARPLPGTTANSNGGGLRLVERCATITSPVTVTITNSLFSGNQTQPGATFISSAGGGIFINQAADITVTDTRIVGNSIVTQNPPVAGANNRGGGLSVDDALTLRIERSEIAGNSADRAAGLRLINDLPARQTLAGVLTVTVVNSTISGNVAVTPVTGGGRGILE